jgi:hypothetical protein
MRIEDIIVWRNIALVPVIVAVIWSLAVILCRKWVKAFARKIMQGDQRAMEAFCVADESFHLLI